MEAAFKPLVEDLTCQLCRQILTEKIRNVVVKWATAKVSGYKHFRHYVQVLTG